MLKVSVVQLVEKNSLPPNRLKISRNDSVICKIQDISSKFTWKLSAMRKVQPKERRVF